jgi:hypothetical protein
MKLPELTGVRKYEHERPRRPSHLPRRLTPPPKRSEPPDLTLFLYAGVVLALVLVILAIPYLIAYLLQVVRF